MAISEFQDNTEKKPLESYSFKFSEEEYNEAMRAYFKGHIVRTVIFGVLIAAFMFYIIFKGDNSFICGLAVGVEAVGLWFLVVALVRSRKSWKKSKAKICASDYNYEFFEDYLLLDIIRGGERAGFHRFDYADLQQKIDTGKYYLLVFANQIYMVKKQEISQTSVFHSLKPKSPEKPSAALRGLSVALFVLSIVSCASGLFVAMSQRQLNGTVEWWLILAFGLIPVGSFAYGVYMKKFNAGLKNVIAGLLTFVMLCVVFFSFVSNDPEDINKYLQIKEIESYMGISLPKPYSYDNFEGSIDGVAYEDTAMQFYAAEAAFVEGIIKDNEKWSAVLTDDISDLIADVGTAEDWDYVSVYNITTDEYNKVPSESGEYSMAAMFYDMDADELRVIEYEYTK